MSLKKLLPPPARRAARKLIKAVRYQYRRVAISFPVQSAKPMKIILGAAETHQDGWYSTNECWLDIANPQHWQNVFKGKKIVTHAVAEHVFEHLTYAECQQAMKNIYNHMTPGAMLRIAVPDGYNRNPEYLRHVGINGIGDDAADHKQLLNVDILSGLLAEAGFKPVHVEGYDAQGNLVQLPYAVADGFIKRSRANPGLKPATWTFPDADTSLIVDGIKM